MSSPRKKSLTGNVSNIQPVEKKTRQGSGRNSKPRNRRKEYVGQGR